MIIAETKGRWWIVGSAWSNIGDAEKDTKSVDAATFSKDKQQNEKLMSKARALGMNTETRKTVFFILMTAEVINLVIILYQVVYNNMFFIGLC